MRVKDERLPCGCGAAFFDLERLGNEDAGGPAAELLHNFYATIARLLGVWAGGHGWETGNSQSLKLAGLLPFKKWLELLPCEFISWFLKRVALYF